MQSSHFVIGTLVMIATLGAAGCADDAQGSDVRHLAVAVPPSAADQELAAQVQEALHADPYFYDKHVTVSVENGNVVLRGFVSSGWDLVDAKKIAARAAGGRHVIDELSINPIQEPNPGVRR